MFLVVCVMRLFIVSLDSGIFKINFKINEILLNLSIILNMLFFLNLSILSILIFFLFLFKVRFERI